MAPLKAEQPKLVCPVHGGHKAILPSMGIGFKGRKLCSLLQEQQIAVHAVRNVASTMRQSHTPDHLDYAQ